MAPRGMLNAAATASTCWEIVRISPCTPRGDACCTCGKPARPVSWVRMIKATAQTASNPTIQILARGEKFIRYSPRNTGGRFSRNALTPSQKSFVAQHEPNCSASFFIPSELDASSSPRMARRRARTARGALAANPWASSMTDGMRRAAGTTLAPDQCATPLRHQCASRSRRARAPFPCPRERSDVGCHHSRV